MKVLYRNGCHISVQTKSMLQVEALTKVGDINSKGNLSLPHLWKFGCNCLQSSTLSFILFLIVKAFLFT